VAIIRHSQTSDYLLGIIPYELARKKKPIELLLIKRTIPRNERIYPICKNVYALQGKIPARAGSLLKAPHHNSSKHLTLDTVV